MRPGTDSRALRLLNAQRIVDVVLASSPDPVSRPEVGRLTGLSKPTVSALVDDLQSAGFLRQAADSVDSGSVGRPASMFEVDPMVRLVIAADIGATKSVVAVADLLGSIVVEETVPTPSNALDALDEVCQRAISLLSTVGGRSAGICVGVPGIYRPEVDGVVQALNLPGFDGVQVAKRLASHFEGQTILVENDVNLAALGELASMGGSRQQVGDFAAISVGTGIGLGLVVDGELYRGGTGSAGELGSIYLTSPSENSPGVTLEGVAAAPSLRKRLGVAIEQGHRTSLTADCDVPEIMAAAADGDDAARLVLTEAASAMSLAISHLRFIADPTQIVLGGGVGANPVFCDAVNEQLMRLSSGASPVVPSELGGRAALLGAVSVAVASVRSKLVTEVLEGSRS
jgi:predicted NBD/HSP70 family sugar kinase